MVKPSGTPGVVLDRVAKEFQIVADNSDRGLTKNIVGAFDKSPQRNKPGFRMAEDCIDENLDLVAVRLQHQILPPISM
jgi:hypothetical protein